MSNHLGVRKKFDVLLATQQLYMSLSKQERETPAPNPDVSRTSVLSPEERGGGLAECGVCSADFLAALEAVWMHSDASVSAAFTDIDSGLFGFESSSLKRD